MMDVDVNIPLNFSHHATDRKEVDPGVPDIAGHCRAWELE